MANEHLKKTIIEVIEKKLEEVKKRLKEKEQ